VLVNLECEERNYSKGGSTFLCAKDGYVAFRNSELISGNLAKKTLGGTAHKNTHIRGTDIRHHT
jgi:DNA-directed RNA polymerase III subunit RPC1